MQSTWDLMHFNWDNIAAYPSTKIAPDTMKENNENAELILVASRWEAMCELLDGKEVSDFMLSFPEVRKLADFISEGAIYV